jgi:hypothetical protein
LEISRGKARNFENSRDRYLVAEFEGLPERIDVSYDYTAYELIVDWKKIGPVKAFDRKTEEYARYTREEGAMIRPSHPRIQGALKSLKPGSPDALDYARRAYAWVQENFRWEERSPSSLDEICSRGAGDCGGLSSVLISLLRAGGVPSRYKTGGFLDPKDGYKVHVWTEFLLQDLGWISADPSFFSGPENPCIGYESERNHFFNRGSDFAVSADRRFQVFQTYSYFYSYSSGKISGNPGFRLNTAMEPLGESPRPEALNSEQGVAEASARLRDSVNAARARRGLGALAPSLPLDAAAVEWAAAASRNEEYPLLERMKALGYEASFYGNYWMAFPSYSLSMEDRFDSFLADALREGRYGDLGVAYAWDEEARLHRYWAVFGARR